MTRARLIRRACERASELPTFAQSQVIQNNLTSDDRALDLLDRIQEPFTSLRCDRVDIFSGPSDF